MDVERLDHAFEHSTDAEVYAHLCAFCACIVSLPQFRATGGWVSPDQAAAGADLGRKLLIEAEETRGNLTHPRQVTAATICISLWIAESYRLLGDEDHAVIVTLEAARYSADLHWPDSARGLSDLLIYGSLCICVG